MAKTPMGKTKPQRGTAPKGAYLCKVLDVDRTKTGENSRVPGCRMYHVQLETSADKRNKGYGGIRLDDWIVVGTEDDPLAKEAETWERSEGGPGRLVLLLQKSGTAVSDNDETWMEALVDQEVVCDVGERVDENGEKRNRIGRPGYYAEGDDDCPEIGPYEEDDEDSPSGRRRSSKAGRAGGKGAVKKGRKAAPDDDDDETDDDEEEKGAANKKAGAAAKKKGKKADEEEEKEKEADDDEDEPKKKPDKKKPADDDDDDDDD